ncbi:MAG: hypothetical protein GTO24_17805 [candidate division Zixibacteria bacterium]|nr:hypothetical protein [candidate division Zixibacteria bacterium]
MRSHRRGEPDESKRFRTARDVVHHLASSRVYAKKHRADRRRPSGTSSCAASKQGEYEAIHRGCGTEMEKEVPRMEGGKGICKYAKCHGVRNKRQRAKVATPVDREERLIVKKPEHIGKVLDRGVLENAVVVIKDCSPPQRPYEGGHRQQECKAEGQIPRPFAGAISVSTNGFGKTVFHNLNTTPSSGASVKEIHCSILIIMALLL